MRRPLDLELSDLTARAFVLAGPHAFGLRPVALTTLDPFLRTLLFNDGLVSRALEAHTLADVQVSLHDQDRASVPAARAALLEVGDASEAVRRRVAIGLEQSAAPAILAESYIIADRLPAAFLALLPKNAGGIGATLEALQVETRRDLPCFGLDAGVAWRDGSTEAKALVRLYRILAGNRPAILITEAFILESRRGMFRLANV